jgi:hypothetical protein
MRYLILLLLLSPAFLMAHPGHGPVDSGPMHFMLSIEHYLGLAAILLMLFALYYRRVKTRDNA